MTPESVTNFLTAYIRSLSEETRQETKGPRYGFDRVIHELALADDLVPVRLSFYRQGDDELSRPKKGLVSRICGLILAPEADRACDRGLFP